jgi:glutamate synthase domain-containing protein 3
MNLSARDIHYRTLNDRIHEAVARGEHDIVLDDVLGHRYIGAGLNGGARLTVHGIPGNDLAAFMNGAEITVHGNAQDGVGNTMNAGRIVIHGDAGDIVGHGMRGGRILVRGSVGYRTGIHMKAFEAHRPVVVIGGVAGDYLGEYMAGGMLVVLGIDANGPSPVGEWVGAGMHGGVIYIRGRVEPWQLGAEVGVANLDDHDWPQLSAELGDFCRTFDLDPSDFPCDSFIRLTPVTSRPYGTLYAY